MPVKQHPTTFKPIPAETLAAFADIPAAVASDTLSRGQTMQGGISPLTPSMTLLGQARTAECPVGDNSAIRAAIGLCEPGQVIVVNAQGFENTAVFGGLMTLYAKERGVAGLVIDGACATAQKSSTPICPCSPATPAHAAHVNRAMVSWMAPFQSAASRSAQAISSSVTRTGSRWYRMPKLKHVWQMQQKYCAKKKQFWKR